MRFRILLQSCTTLLSAIAVLAQLGNGTSIQAHADSPDEAELKSVRVFAESYFGAYQKRDLETLSAAWSNKSPEAETQKNELRRLLSAYEVSLKNLHVSKLILEGQPPTKAACQVSADLVAVERKRESTFNEKLVRNLELVKENGAWKLWRHSSAYDDLAAQLLMTPTQVARKARLEASKDLLDEELARSLFYAGAELADRLQLRRSIEALKLAKSIAEQVNAQEVVSRSLNRLGGVYHRLGDLAEASASYQAALAMVRSRAKKGDELNSLAQALINLGSVYQEQGDNLRALRLTQEGLEITERLDHSQGIGHAMLVIGRVQESSRDYPAALKSYARAYAKFGAANVPQGQATARNNMGVVSAALGEFEQAERYYREALKLAEDSRYVKEVVNIWNNIGLLRHVKAEREAASGKLDSAKTEREAALKVYQEFLPRARSLGLRSNETNILSDMAHTYLTLGRPKEALDLANQAVALAEKTGYQSAMWQARTFAAQAYRHLNQPDKAHSELDAAVAGIENLRYLVGGAEMTRQRFLEDKLGPYHEKIALLMSEGKVTDAFRYAERAKARVLLDVLRFGRFNPATRMTVKDQEEEQALLAKLRLLNRELSLAQQALTALSSDKSKDESRRAQAKARLEQRQSELDEARQAHQAFEQRLFVTDPGLKVRRGDAPAVTLDEVSRMFPDGRTALIEFVVLNDATYVFVATKGAEANGKVIVKGTTLPVKRMDILALVAGSDPKPGKLRQGGFRDQLAANDLDYDVAARRLYELLLKPIKEHLAGKSRLVIVPDDILWELQFHALQSGPNHFLVEDFAISYAPSLTVLRDMRAAGDAREPKGKQLNPPTVLALGNPSLPAAALELASAAHRAEGLGKLANAEEEVEDLKGVYGADRVKALTRADAREEVVKAESGKHQIIHFATHGIFDNNNPVFSYLLLAQSEKKADEVREDGYLEAWEVMKLNLKMTHLAVLAACQTGRGRVGAGEGVIGMSWAFFVAGCPTTVVSHWYVDDKATKDLMVSFHKNLADEKAPLSKAEALRQAQFSVMKRPDRRYRHPYYWAAFTLVGDGR